MLVSLTTVLQESEHGKYAVIAPNFFNLVSARSLIETAANMHAPLILSYSLRFRECMDVPSFEDFISTIIKMIDDVRVPIVLHLDHGLAVNDIYSAINAGFSSVMFDGSMLPYAENIRLTRLVVEKARSAGISVEAELGHVGSGDSYSSGEVETSADQNGSVMTDPLSAKQFVNETGVDALAVSIGTVHGYYETGSPSIDFDLLKRLNATVPVPLVLHGGSGVAQTDLQKTILLGIRKINVWSDLSRELGNEIEKINGKPYTGPDDLVYAIKNAMGKILRTYIAISGSKGAA